MANPLEQIIRPFADQDVTPTPFTQPGASSQPLVVVRVGLKGGTKTFSTSGQTTTSTSMGKKHTEKAPNSEALQQALSSAAQG